MRLEISQVRESNVKDVRAMEDICCVKQDISDIKSKVCFTPTSNVGEQSTNEISNSNQCLLPTYANIVREKPENGIQHINGNVEPDIAPSNVPPTRRNSQSQQLFSTMLCPRAGDCILDTKNECRFSNTTNLLYLFYYCT